jgi:hypothetical protein
VRYTLPQNVVSPQDFVRNVRVIHDGGEESFSLALLEWESGTCIGIRWNIARREWEDPTKVREERECVGMPTSRGYPVWFILPDDISDGSFDLSGCILDFKKKVANV